MKSIIPMPKAIHAPKIAHIALQKMSNGWKAQHFMTHGPHPKPFVFSDPAKMMKHLNRIQASHWREPDRDDAHRVTGDLNLGPTV